MSPDPMMKKQSLLCSPEKTYELPIYANQMATAFVDFGCSKPKRRKDTYALNVLQFIDGFASEGRESSDSSKSFESATDCTTT
jgi:hypothetical protein